MPSPFSRPPENQHKFGCLMAAVPPELGQRFKAFVTRTIDKRHLGPGGASDDFHVTVKYGFTDDAHAAVRSVLRGVEPFTVRIVGQSMFTNNKDGDVLKLDVESEVLRELNGLMTRSFRCVDKHPVYRPHLTLAYLNPQHATRYVLRGVPFVGESFLVDTLVWSGKSGRMARIKLGEGEKDLSWQTPELGGALVPPPAPGVPANKRRMDDKSVEGS